MNWLPRTLPSPRTIAMLSASAVMALAGCDDDAQSMPDVQVTDMSSAEVHDAAGPGIPNDTSGQPDLGSGDGIATGDNLTHVDEGSGVTVTIVDAADATAWVYVDLDARAQVDPAAGTWDVAFQRFKVKVNGGVSGSGSVQVATLDGQSFAVVAQAPSIDGQTYVTDQADGPDDDTDPDLAFDAAGTWYDYDAVNHVLAPRADRVYVLTSSEGAWFKVAVVDYYSAAGDAGFPTLRWSTVAAPEPGGPTVPADGLLITDDAPAYLSLATAPATPVTPAAPETSNAWDLLIDGLSFATNSGTSGAGFGGALVLSEDGQSFDDLDVVDTVGFSVDKSIPAPGPPGTPEFSGNAPLTDWWNYDPSTHSVSPKDIVYAVRRADGQYAKLKVTSAISDGIIVRFGSLTRQPATHSVSIAAPSDGDWVYFSFRTGQIVDAAEVAAGSGLWDVALLGTQWRTNSGTSGNGQGGAVAATETFDALAEAPAEGYVGDTMVPVPGPPGSGEVSANSALAGWYDYDPVTHTVSPKDMAFALQASDGSFVKLKITAYAGGETSLDFVYAGPGHSSF